MSRINEQVWATSALTNVQLMSAIRLNFCLRETATTRKLALIAAPTIADNLKLAAESIFDFVFYTDENRFCNLAVNHADLGKLYAIQALQGFRKIVYLNPTVFVLENIDELFDVDVKISANFLLLSVDTSAFVLESDKKELANLFYHLQNKTCANLVDALNEINGNLQVFLPEKYNVVEIGKPLINCSLINLADYQTQTSMSKLRECGLVENLIANRWEKIQREKIEPLLNGNLSPNLETFQSQASEPIAVIGISCRYPKCKSLDEFWQMLYGGENISGPPPTSRWPCDMDASCKNTQAGFIQEPVDTFDASFFGISAQEALFMDPQHRLLLQLAWESLEDACINPQSLCGAPGSVYFGCWLQDYKKICNDSLPYNFYRSYMGNSMGAAAARVSFLLGLTGPCIATESGCSSAMVALHLAVQGLRNGETNLALACGVNLMLEPFNKDMLPMMLSAEGRCRAFSEDANGYARSDGAAVFVLKRLSDALKDKDHIRAVIRGSAVSQEGTSRSMGTPTVDVEAQAMERALADAGVTPDEVSYVEAHSTGTPVGDPVEVAAITRAYKSGSRAQPLIIGSVKTNVGHTEATSGLTSLIKVILALEHGTIPAHVGFSKLNPQIRLDLLPAVIPLERQPWKRNPNKRRLAGVSSFGITGTDVHVIVEEAPLCRPQTYSLTCGDMLERPLHLLKVAAKCDTALQLLLQKYRRALLCSSASLENFAFTGNTGRADFPVRAVLVGSSKAEIVAQIEKQEYIRKSPEGNEPSDKICFLFTGELAEYNGMGQTLWHTSPVFRLHFDHCAHILKHTYNIDITRDLWTTPTEADIHPSVYSETRLFCVEYALAKLWESWGVRPHFVLGHGLGEFPGAVCAGLLSLETGLELLAHQSNLPAYRQETASSLEKGGGEICEHISGLMGNLVEGDTVRSSDHTRHPVQFLRDSQRAVELGCTTFVEIGPHPGLSSLNSMAAPITSLPSLKRGQEPWTTLLCSLATFYVNGGNIDWKGVDHLYSRRKIPLPDCHYPFQGKRFWPTEKSRGDSSEHPLLGSSLPNATSTRLFQHQVSLQSLQHEYLKDHAIGSVVVMPGAAFLEICAAAGLSGLNTAEQTRPFSVEDLDISAPLALPAEGSTLLQTVTNPQENYSSVNVRIFHQQPDGKPEWVEHASGTYFPVAKTGSEEHPNIANFLDTIGKQPPVHNFYERVASVGLNFGPAFRSLKNIWYSPDESKMVAQVEQIPNEQNYLIHPLILDAMIQAIFCFELASKLRKNLYVPVKIGRFVWLQKSKLVDNETRYVSVYKTESSKEKSSTTAALLLDFEGQVLAIMSHVQFMATLAKTVQSLIQQQSHVLPDMLSVGWSAKPGPMQNFHGATQCQNALRSCPEFEERMREKYNQFTPDLQEINATVNKLAYLYILQCFYDCGFQAVPNTTFNTQQLFVELQIDAKYSRLFRYFLCILKEEKVVDSLCESDGTWRVIGAPNPVEVRHILQSPEYNEKLTSRLKGASLVHQLGKHMREIVTGRELALPIFFPEENSRPSWTSANDFNADYGKVFPSLGLIKEVLRRNLQLCKISHENNNPDYILRIGEVGAGTGTGTRILLQVLQDLKINFEYTFTDVSAAFFGKAESKFEKHLSNMVFRKLDLEEDPISQGFTPAYFDVILAVDVVHATRNLKETLKHINLLLKPGGRLELSEQTKVIRLIACTFGFLEGFWRFEDTDLREHYCMLSKDKWGDTLKWAGFDTVCVYPFAENRHAFYSARKIGNAPDFLSLQTEKINDRIWLLFHEESSSMSKYLLESLLNMTDRHLVVVTKGETFAVKKSTSRITHVVIDEKTEEDFLQVTQLKPKFSIEGVLYCWALVADHCQDEVLKPLLFLSKALVSIKAVNKLKCNVLIKGTSPLQITNVHCSTLVGFLKSLRSEQPHLCCRVVDVGDPQTEAEFLQIFYELWTGTNEVQVAYSGNVRHVPKILPWKPVLSELRLPPGIIRYSLVLPETKAIADLQFGSIDTFTLRDLDIEIEVKTAALNFRDVLSVLKPSDEFLNSNTVGFDFAGVVTKIGTSVTRWVVGDAVFGINLHGKPLPSHICKNQLDVFPIPKSLSFHEACTIPTAYSTAYHTLIEIAQLKNTDTVLIHAASGGVGLCAIRICQHVGATVIATVGSQRKENYLRGLGVEHVFHSRNTKFEQEVLKVTVGRGVQVVLNSLTSAGFKEASLNCCASGATFVEMSKISVWSPDQVKALRPDVHYVLVDLHQISLEEWRRLLSCAEEFRQTHKIRLPPYTCFDGVHIQDALTYVQKAKQIGKVVVTLPQGRSVEDNQPLFHDQATYLITGGLGGIGFLLCEWMVKKGARHVVLVGRKPPTLDQSEKISQLNVSFQASVISAQMDVANWQECQHLLKVRLPELDIPPLRGIMHAAGVLHDALVENQTWHQFQLVFKPKIQGTWNLHRLTKDSYDLEHFVMFSSMASLLGTPGQCSHAATNQFEDNFAHYRHSLGLPALAINWGQWGEVGVAVEADFQWTKPLSNLQALAALEISLRTQQTQVGLLNLESWDVLSHKFPHIFPDFSASKENNSSALPLLQSTSFWEKYYQNATAAEKQTFIKETVKALVLRTLGWTSHEEIADLTNFVDTGFDSLMFVQLKNALQTLLGDQVALIADSLRNCTNLQDYATHVFKMIEGESVLETQLPTQAEVIELLKQDSELPAHIHPQSGHIRVKPGQVSVVLLTGVTGTLGPYLLRELCQYTQISQVVCLIRTKIGSSLDERLTNVLEKNDLLSQIDMKRVMLVAGDVAQEKLGLESDLYASLCTSVDYVVHAAAFVHHTEQYCNTENNSTRSVNVQGVKHILEFCVQGPNIKSLYFASSLAAATKEGDDGTLEENWPDFEDHVRNGVTTFAYPNSKFVGEMLMKQAVERGIPVTVFRFPFITGHSITGRFSPDQNHLMLRYFFVLKNGSMPNIPIPIIVLPVDICAAFSIRMFLCEQTENSVCHVFCSQACDDQEFVKVAEKLGVKVELVDYDTFANLINNTNSQDSYPSLFKDFYKAGVNVANNFPVAQQWAISGRSRKDYFTGKKMLQLFRNWDAELVTCNGMDHIYKNMLYAKSQNWI